MRFFFKFFTAKFNRFQIYTELTNLPNFGSVVVLLFSGNYYINILIRCKLC